MSEQHNGPPKIQKNTVPPYIDIVLSSQKEFVDNVVIQEPLGSSDHNQLHFNVKIKSVKTKVKQCRRDFRKGNYKEIRKRLAHFYRLE